MRIAHISDLHLLSLAGAVPWRLFNKRATGWVNLRLKRAHAHKPDVVRTIAAHLRESGVDHVAITGDVSNLALEAEFELVREVIDDVLGLPADRVSIVPGNHDLYTRGSEREQRFAHFLAPYLKSDLPDFASAHPSGAFPFVKLRGPVAIIGLSSAVSRLPLVAAGWLGEAQLEALARLLEHPEVRSRTPVLLQHHPAHNPPSRLKAMMEGLHDAPGLARCLAGVSRGLILHGHLHTRIHRELSTDAGYLDVVGATSASLLHEKPERMAGYNLYEITDEGVISDISSRVLDVATGQMTAAPMPKTHWH